MNNRQAQYILAIAETKSISKVAEQNYISQPSLSQMLKKVEEEFGVELFRRVSGKELEITDAGEVVVQGIHELMQAESRMLNKLAEVRKEARGKVNFGIARGCNLEIVNHLIPAFSAKYPHVEINMVRVIMQTIERMLLNREMDIAISYYEEIRPELDYIPIPSGSLVLVCPIAYREEITTESDEDLLKSLIDKPFIQLNKGLLIREWTDQIFCRINTISSKIIETNDITLACTMVEAGMGYSIVPLGYLQSRFSTGKIVKYPIRDLSANKQMAIIYRKDTYITHYLSDLISLCREWAETNGQDERIGDT